MSQERFKAIIDPATGQPKEAKVRNGPSHPTARLAVAARSGDMAAFERALADGGDPLAPAALINACSREDEIMCRALLLRGADPMAQDSRGVNAISRAYRSRNGALLGLMLAGEPDKAAALEAGVRGNGVGVSLFSAACKEGDARSVELLLALGHPEPDARHLLLAARSAGDEAARLVWGAMSARQKAGAASIGLEILHAGSFGGNCWAIDLALDELGQGVDAVMPSARTISGAMKPAQRALEAATAGSSVGLEHLLKRGASVAPVPGMIHATAVCALLADGVAAERFELLARHGANVDEPAERGMSPLGIICGSVQPGDRAVRKLLELGANPNRYDDHGDTPLHKAILRDRFDLTLALLEFGADPSLRRGLSAQEWIASKFKGAQANQAFSVMEARQLRETAGAASAPTRRRAPGI